MSNDGEKLSTENASLVKTWAYSGLFIHCMKAPSALIQIRTMACSLDLKLLLKHLANGTICENLCRVCLQPLTEESENIFSRICKEDKEYCIADVLKDLCHIKISDADHYSVCSECFIASSEAYKFYLNTKRNDAILHYYADELQKNLNNIELPDDLSGESICISLPAVSIEKAVFGYNIQNHKNVNEDKKFAAKKITVKKETPMEYKKPEKEEKVSNKEDTIVMVKDENGESTFFKVLPNGSLKKVRFNSKLLIAAPPAGNKKRKIREPMTSKKCFRCPIQYRFIAKLQEHMQMAHGVTLYSCKVCQALTEDEEFHKFHVKTHTNLYKCDICSACFKKRDAIMNHMRDHEMNKNVSSDMNMTDYVCVQCGQIFRDKDDLYNHVNLNHYKKFACYYCGRVYKMKKSFDMHIKKHEMYTKAYEERRKQQEKRTFTNAEAKVLIAKSEAQESPVSKDYTCELCGRGFLGARALLWHSRIHTNERPFKCDTCSRTFVSLNRRNQHALCAHTAPTRRCPLCPARFHMRSMVNTHIKKVHLKPHKRRTRTVPESGAALTPVPIQELSVAIQQDILDLQARNFEAELQTCN